MAATALEHVLRHNAWANRALLDHCAALGPAALELESAGTYGTLYGALQHVVGAEQFYIGCSPARCSVRRSARPQRRTLEDLIAIAAMTGARAIDIAAKDDPDRVIGERDSDDWTTAGSCSRSS